MSLPKHRARAVEAMAKQLCETDFTNGFCCVQDGKCQRNTAESRPDRNCMKVAEGLMRSMEGRGVSVVWDHDPGRHPDPAVDAAERAAIEGL